MNEFKVWNKDAGSSPCEGGGSCEDAAYTLFISGGCDEGVQGIDAGGTPCSSSPCEGGGSSEDAAHTLFI